MKARILQDNSYGGVFTNDFINERWNTVVNEQLVSEWVLTDVLPDENIHIKTWNGEKWTEGATSDEIEQFEDSKYPNTITAVQFELEVIYSGLKLAIDKAIEELEEPTKSIVIVKRTKATEFDRKDSFIQDIGSILGMTKQDINQFFLRANER